MKLSVILPFILFPSLAMGFSSSPRYSSFNRALSKSSTSSNLQAAFSSTLFTPADDNVVNNRHSAADWVYNVRSIFQSQILREVRGPVLAVAGWSAVVSVVHKICLQSSSLQQVAHNMCIPGTMHSFLVSAIGLLLVFRTNSAYQRFYEGRKIWENILSISRNLSRMVQLYSNEVGSQRKTRLLNLVAAFPYLLRLHIRPGFLCSSSNIPEEHALRLKTSVAALDTRFDGDKHCRPAVEEQHRRQPHPDCVVDRRELPWSLLENKNKKTKKSSKTSLDHLASTDNRPLWVCDRLGKAVMGIPYGPNFTSRERLTLLGQIEKLTNCVGQCERIHQTAVPLNYARHSLRSLTLWLFTLPFCLVQDLGLLTALVTACIAWILFGVYQIGYSIEDPFQGSLRLSILCDAIRKDVLGHDTIVTSERLEEDVQAGAADVMSFRNIRPAYPIVDSSLRTTSSESSRSSSMDPEHFLLPSPLVQENGTWRVVNQPYS